MALKFAVCGLSTPSPTSICSECRQSCHTRCSGKKRNAPCDLCRLTKKASSTPKTSLSSTKKNHQMSIQQPRPSNLQRATPSSGRASRHQLLPLVASMPAVSKQSRDSSASASPLCSLLNTGPERVQREASQQAPASVSTGNDTTGGDVGRVADFQAPSSRTLLGDCISYAEQIPDKTGGATQNQQSSSTHFAPLGDRSLSGVTNILIPVSTLELYFRRFDMLEQQLDKLKSLVSRGPVSGSVSSVSMEGGAAIDMENLNARVSALEGKISDGISATNATLANTKLLLETGEKLKEVLNETKLQLSNFCRADKAHTQQPGSGPPSPQSEDSQTGPSSCSSSRLRPGRGVRWGRW